MTISLSNIQSVLQNEDVEGLIALGAPSDEYNQEARDIASALALLSPKQLTVTNVTETIRGVWVKYFGPFSNEDIMKRRNAFQSVARRLLS